MTTRPTARSLRSLPIRVERQNATAMKVALAMRAHPQGARVLYRPEEN